MSTRRQFLLLLAAALLTSARAGAQPRARVWRLGYLILNPLSEPPSPERAAFIAALRELGYVVGTNLEIEYRSADFDRERLSFLAEELVNAKVDAIVVASADPARAAMNATKTIPIIMLGIGDPVAFGLVTNLARPESNVSGVSWQSIDLVGKRFTLLKEMLPRARRAAILWNPETVEGEVGQASARDAAQRIGFALDELRVSDLDGLRGALAVLDRTHPDVLYVNIDAKIAPYRQIIADAAIRLKIPSVSGYRGFADAGGLMAYGASLTDLYRRAAKYVDRVFRGAKPADLPIEQPINFDLVINLKTAKALGLSIPQSLLLRASEVIE
jgi:putative ABC transport system substrate-binding protein